MADPAASVPPLVATNAAANSNAAATPIHRPGTIHEGRASGNRTVTASTWTPSGRSPEGSNVSERMPSRRLELVDGKVN